MMKTRWAGKLIAFVLITSPSVVLGQTRHLTKRPSTMDIEFMEVTRVTPNNLDIEIKLGNMMCVMQVRATTLGSRLIGRFVPDTADKSTVRFLTSVEAARADVSGDITPSSITLRTFPLRKACFRNKVLGTYQE